MAIRRGDRRSVIETTEAAARSGNLANLYGGGARRRVNPRFGQINALPSYPSSCLWA
jgi:hypothetical protein